MVESGETVTVESGSACAMLAAELAQARDAALVTNSAFIAGFARQNPGARAVLLGGCYDPDAQGLSGSLVKKCAEAFFVDKFFIGADSFDPDQGFSNADLARAEAARDMARQAKRRIILTDSSKFNRRGARRRGVCGRRIAALRRARGDPVHAQPHEHAGHRALPTAGVSGRRNRGHPPAGPTRHQAQEGSG